MRKQYTWIAGLAISLTLLPERLQAQTFAGDIHSLQRVLDGVYNDMVPLCSQLIGVGRGVAGFAALWYIAARVWRSIANAEPIDFYPLLRPFAIGLAILLFPSVIALMNGVLNPTVAGTAAMMSNSNNAIAYLLKQKEEAIRKTITGQLYGEEGTHGNWYRYTFPDGEEEDPDLLSNGIRFMMAKAAFSLKNSIKLWMSEILHVLYEAAALCINTIRTFYLIVLAVIGPIVFGLSVFDGLHHTLTAWIARYINVFLWLPVANIFGSIIAKVQENMLRRDIEQIELYGETFFSASDTAYIIFLIIGIIGYFTVPSIAGYIVHAGGNPALLHRSTSVFGGAVHKVSASTFGVVSTGARAAYGLLQPTPAEKKADEHDKKPEGKTPADQHQHDKIKGN